MFAALQSQVSDFVSNVNLPSLPTLPDALSNLTTTTTTTSSPSSSLSSSTQNHIENRSLIQYSQEFSSEDEDDSDNDHITLDIHHSSSNNNNTNNNNNNNNNAPPIGDTVKFYANQIGSTASHVGGSIATNVNSWRQTWFSSSSSPSQQQQPSSTTTTITTTTTTPLENNNGGAQEYLSSWKESASKRLDDVWTRIKPVEQPPIVEENSSKNGGGGWLDQWTNDFDQYTTMSKTSRLYGFGITCAIGIIFIALAMGFLPSILVAARVFALFYTFGNCFLIASTFFLVGPTRQLGMMFERDRFIPSSLFLSSLFLTLFVAMVLKSAFLVLILLCVQIVSLAYYILSYIPFGQQIVNVFFTSISTAVRAMF